jgi:hypothetical protein
MYDAYPTTCGHVEASQLATLADNNDEVDVMGKDIGRTFPLTPFTNAYTWSMQSDDDGFAEQRTFLHVDSSFLLTNHQHRGKNVPINTDIDSCCQCIKKSTIDGLHR